MHSGKIIKYILLIAIVSCSRKSEHQRLADFINDPENKLTQSIRVGDVQIIARCLPYAYKNLSNITNDDTIQNDGYCYFDIKFIKENLNNLANEKLQYLNFDMQNDFSLLLGNDSLSPGICQKIENGRSDNFQYIVAFEKPLENMGVNDYTLFYQDKIFGTGMIAFVFKQANMSKIPIL